MLQLNGYLNGYNFLGGHIEEGESPREAAIRELKEETGREELTKRWGMDLTGEVPEEEWQRVSEALEEIEGPFEGGFKFPFYSSRAKRTGQPPEKTAQLYLYRLRIEPGQYPKLSERLQALTTTRRTYVDNKVHREVCRFFTPAEFMVEAWRNRDNPFLRFAIKAGVIEMEQKEKLAPPYILNLSAFEGFLQERLVRLLGDYLGLHLGEALEIRILPPKKNEPHLCMRVNRTLKARLELRWTGSDEIFRLSFPYPEAGVFILHSDNSRTAGKWIWHPRLVSRPGLWLLNKQRISKGKREITELLHLALPGTRYLELPLEEKARQKTLRKWQKRSPVRSSLMLPGILGGQGEGECDLLQGIEKEFPSLIIKNNKSQHKKLFSYLERATNEIGANDQDALDEQDLRYQRLYTYSAHLAENYLKILAEQLIRLKKETPPEDVWTTLCRAAYTTERRLVPVSDLQRTGWLHQFDPMNGIDALSRLTSFQRSNANKKALERYPAVLRQNHPSFHGVICPVDSPESKKVGITLHLARGVRADVLGRLVPAKENEVNDGLGYAASLVPFYQHNDGARSMMGAKNLKQAVPVTGNHKPVVATGHEGQVEELVQPLVEAGISAGCIHAAPGTDLLVAYMPWYGWNYEDAIVVSRRLVDEGILDWVTEDQCSEYILPGYSLTDPVPENAIQAALIGLMYDENKLRRCGEITPEAGVAFFRDPKSGEIHPISCGGDGPGELVEVKYSNPPSSLLGGTLSWKVRRRSPLMVGDKLMGRYGNKGVVSIILPPDELPRFPDDPRLPENLRGRAVDLVLNPHGVISRMNLGQLLETHIGLLHHLGVKPEGIPGEVGNAFTKVDLGLVRSSLLRINGKGDRLVDEYGRMSLTLSDGNKTEAPVTVGFQNIVRLRHVAARKAQVRGMATQESQYLYNLITGQPVGGRKNRGGQRVGEMEVWALAAHQADKNLESILGRKSDPSWVQNSEYEYGQTFQAIRDHLFALGISTNDMDGKLGLGWATPEMIQKQGGAVTQSTTWSMATEGRFHCSAKSCNYRYPKPIIATGKPQRSNVLRLTVGDVLVQHGYLFPNDLEGAIPEPKDDSPLKIIHKIELVPLSPDKKKKEIQITCTRKKELKIQFMLGNDVVVAYKQVSGDVKISEIAGMFITCPDHATSFLVCDRERIIPVPVEGGLCDPKLFGDIDMRLPGEEKWGYIELPFPVEYPQDSKTIKFGESDQPPQLGCIPVLPLKYRYRKPGRIGISIIPEQEKLTKLYARIAELAKPDKTKKKKSIEDEKIKKAQIRKATLDVFNEIHHRLFGKYGLIRRFGMGRRVDASGRLVIVPDPTLEWDECGVPTSVLIQLLGDRIAKWDGLKSVQELLLHRLIAAYIHNEITGHEILEEYYDDKAILKKVRDLSIWQDYDWLARCNSNNELLEIARYVLECYLKEHPQITVILNRQPSLHRYSMMGFRPVPLPPEDGLVLKIHPLVCKGFAADFDGDEMAIHMPITDEEHSEAESLKPTKPWNLISVADNSPIASFDQDFVLGHFLISRDEQLRKKLCGIFPIATCETCKDYLQTELLWDKGKGTGLLRHICESHSEEAAGIIPAWMRLAFEAATLKGVSFGFLELEGIRKNIANAVEETVGSVTGVSDLEALGAITADLGKLTIEYLGKLENQGCDDFATPGYGFAAMAVSGARGTSQTRQLVAARGYLAPGDTGFESPANHFFVADPLVTGMEVESSIWAAMNNRSSMIDKKLGTPKAGDLTRRLVLAGWNWYVKDGTCGVDDKSKGLAGCKWAAQKVICSACYGEVTGYNRLPDGYPAGLIAAQSFGERGTQLSMQSFHTGERQLSMDEVVSLLDGKDPMSENGVAGEVYNWFEDEDDCMRFVERIRKEDAYKNIDEKHLLLIWLMIHTSNNKTLRDAWFSGNTPLSSLVGPGQWSALLECIREKTVDNMSSPFTRVMTGRAPVLSENLSGGET